MSKFNTFKAAIKSSQKDGREFLIEYITRRYTLDDEGAINFLNDFGINQALAIRNVFNSSSTVTFRQTQKGPTPVALYDAMRDIGSNYSAWFNMSGPQLSNLMNSDPNIKIFGVYSAVGVMLWIPLIVLNDDLVFPRGNKVFSSTIGSNTFTNIANIFLNGMLQLGSSTYHTTRDGLVKNYIYYSFLKSLQQFGDKSVVSSGHKIINEIVEQTEYKVKNVVKKDKDKPIIYISIFLLILIIFVKRKNILKYVKQ